MRCGGVRTRLLTGLHRKHGNSGDRRHCRKGEEEARVADVAHKKHRQYRSEQHPQVLRDLVAHGACRESGNTNSLDGDRGDAGAVKGGDGTLRNEVAVW